ncbi:hypothetical protein B5D80_26920 [Micromonospora wenchangensis]|uniref:Uncharacterized protein n=1 Tax=Micromonospora wenchangensis TaxID=1185415 RepID=A0A246RGE9_9ACTN|nr:hypothetical protein B5D80_26920 [Micromonospora wenchangensis]
MREKYPDLPGTGRPGTGRPGRRRPGPSTRISSAPPGFPPVGGWTVAHPPGGRQAPPADAQVRRTGTAGRPPGGGRAHPGLRGAGGRRPRHGGRSVPSRGRWPPLTSG